MRILSSPTPPPWYFGTPLCLAQHLLSFPTMFAKPSLRLRRKAQIITTNDPTVVVSSQPIKISPALLAFVTYPWPQVLYQTVPVSICLLSFWALLLPVQIASYHLLSLFDFMQPISHYHWSSQLCYAFLSICNRVVWMPAWFCGLEEDNCKFQQ